MPKLDPEKVQAVREILDETFDEETRVVLTLTGLTLLTVLSKSPDCRSVLKKLTFKLAQKGIDIQDFVDGA